MELRFDGNAAVKPSESVPIASMPMPMHSAPPPEKPNNAKAENEARPEVIKQAISVQDTQRAVAQANKLMELFSHDLKFETHDKTGIIQISIVDKKDGKVIKQLPPDEVLDMVAKIKEMLGGLMDVKG